MFYSQNFEDVYLARCFPGNQPRFYVDVGAHHPTFESVTRHFYDKGWCGLNIDPDPDAFIALSSERKNDVNIKAICWDKDQLSLPFYRIPGTARSTALQSWSQQALVEGYSCTETSSPTVTLNSVLEKYYRPELGEFAFLKIDAEGAEINVLKGIDLRKYRPGIILIESLDLTGKSSGEFEITCGRYLLDNGYVKVFFDGVNQYWCSKECSNLVKHFELPPGCLDGIRPYQIYEAQSRSEMLESRILSLEKKAVQSDPKKSDFKFILISQPSPGLLQDRVVVKEILQAIGYEVEDLTIPSVYFQTGQVYPNPADWSEHAIVIMFEHVFQFANKPLVSTLFVNPEWLLPRDIALLNRNEVDILLAKSRDAEKRLRNGFQNIQVVYTGFASKQIDRLCAPDFSKSLHVKGYASQKGSNVIFDMYRNDIRSELPPCVCTMRSSDKAMPLFISHISSTCKVVIRNIEQRAMDKMSSRFGIHLCPSIREGFGHYIFGPMSIGSLVVTSDAPPMNEIVDPDCGVLVPAQILDRGLYVDAVVSPKALKESLMNLKAMTSDEKAKMSSLAVQKAASLRSDFEMTFGFFIQALVSSITA